jgi:hypothetical protein
MPRAPNPDEKRAAVVFYIRDLERDKLRVLAAENGTTPNMYAKRLILEAVYQRFPELKPPATKDQTT